MNRSIELEGFGKLVLYPLNVKDKEYEMCDKEGKALTKEMVGEGRKTIYKNEDKVEIPSSQICRKFVIENEELICPKFQITKKISGEDMEIIDSNDEMYRALERKVYFTFCESSKLKQMIIEQNKTIVINGLIVGVGWKCWRAILTNYAGHICLVCCRGDLNKALEQFKDEAEAIEFEIDIIPERKETAKKLLKAVCY